VALTYVKLGAGASKVDHLILIAPTRRGVVDAFRIVVHPERFLRRVFTTDMVATWPSVAELLPQDGKFLVDQQGHTIDRDLWTPEGWNGIQHAPLQLAAARTLRDALAAHPMPSTIRLSVIAGDCVATAHRVLMRRDGSFAFYPSELQPSERALEPILFEPGDGTVPISSATSDSEAMIVCDGHQGIAADPTVHRAIIRTLREGPPL
jgi:hypothetical protein